MRALIVSCIGFICILFFTESGFSQNSYPSSGKALIESIDVGINRDVGSSAEGLNLAHTTYTNIQLTHDTWSGTHALLFNAYKSTGGPTGNLANANNTQYANDVGAYGGGAGALMFFGNGGSMNFYISETSTGQNDYINWGTPKMTIKRNGQVGIGTVAPSNALTVAGIMNAREIIVEEDAGADFVFEEGYKLPGLTELEDFILSNKHLPEIPTASQMKKDGVKVGELQIKLLQKIEELTLYIIEQNKSKAQLEEKVGVQQEIISQLIQRVEQLESKRKSP